MDSSENKKFYVYALLDPRKQGSFRYGCYEFSYEPFYIGKGNRRRAWGHACPHPKDCNHAKTNKIRRIKEVTGITYLVSIVKNSVSQEEAFALEESLIRAIAGNDLRNSPLTNQTYGGGPGSVWSLGSRKRGSEAQKERFQRDAEREKARQAYLTWLNEHPEEHCMNVRKRNATLRKKERRNRISQKMKDVYGKDKTITERQTLSRNMTFENNPGIAVRISRSLGGRPIEVYKDGEFVDYFETQRACMRKMGFGPCFVTKRLHGGGRGKNGYEIRFANPSECNSAHTVSEGNHKELLEHGSSPRSSASAG